ncbi:MAG: cysteine desulfurase [Chthonomonas sp.]|nr:cysteine desulfurase [Chthonomonas sp.]
MKRYYLDHAATTLLRPEVRERMQPWLELLGNPSSSHAHGRAAKAAIDVARERVSAQLGVLFGEICFVGSGTEAANLALLGLAIGTTSERRRILVSAAEHHCMLHPGPVLKRLGFELEEIPIDADARVDTEALAEMMGDDVLAVVAMHANNEFGTFNDLAAIRGLCDEHGSLLIVDAVQTAGHYELRPEAMGADIMTFSSHKFGGPKGVGALWIKSGTQVEALVRGGGQERDLRGGTENVAGIVAFADAWDITAERRDIEESAKLAARDAFLAALGPQAIRTVSPGQPTLSGHAHVRFANVLATSLLIAIDRRGVSASSGSACSSGSLDPSHVLLAAGYDMSEAQGGLRFSFGPETTPGEALEAAEIVLAEASRIAGR